MNRSGKLHALLSTARVANIPSLMSNVWLGVAVAWILAASDGVGDMEVPWGAFLLLSVAGTALYVSGNFLNDWMDRDWDAVKRPERALPRGLFRPPAYFLAALYLAAIGIGIAASSAAVDLLAVVVAFGIFGCVVLYTWIHKKTVWSVIPMGLCRALLPIMGAAGVMGWDGFDGRVWFLGVALLCYIAGLSLAARFESTGALMGRQQNLTRALFMTPLALWLAFVLLNGDWSWLAMAGFPPYVIWVLFCDRMRRAGTFRFVSLLLAGIPLVAWIFLLPIGLVHPSGAFGMLCVALPPLAFISALLLQRIAPAT